MLEKQAQLPSIALQGKEMPEGPQLCLGSSMRPLGHHLALIALTCHPAGEALTALEGREGALLSKPCLFPVLNVPHLPTAFPPHYNLLRFKRFLEHRKCPAPIRREHSCVGEGTLALNLQSSAFTPLCRDFHILPTNMSLMHRPSAVRK